MGSMKASHVIHNGLTFYRTADRTLALLPQHITPMIQAIYTTRQAEAADRVSSAQALEDFRQQVKLLKSGSLNGASFVLLPEELAQLTADVRALEAAALAAFPAPPKRPRPGGLDLSGIMVYRQQKGV